MKKLLSIILIICLVLFMSGCSSDPDDMNDIDDVEEDMDVDMEIETDEGTMTIKGDEENIEIETESGEKITYEQNSKELPEGFPEDVLPISKDIVVTGTQKYQLDEGITSFNISILSKTSPKEIYEYFKGLLEDGTDTGFLEEGDDTYFISGTKDNWIISIDIHPDDLETEDMNTGGIIMLYNETPVED